MKWLINYTIVFNLLISWQCQALNDVIIKNDKYFMMFRNYNI